MINPKKFRRIRYALYATKQSLAIAHQLLHEQFEATSKRVDEGDFAVQPTLTPRSAPTSVTEEQAVTTEERLISLNMQDQKMKAIELKLAEEKQKNSAQQQCIDDLNQYNEFLQQRLQSLSMLEQHQARRSILKRREGIPVESPSGLNYTLHKTKKNQKAILNHDQIVRHEGESEEQLKQRLAVTVIHMIDNVLMNSKIITIRTEDPFVVATAQIYIEYINATRDEPVFFCNKGVNIDSLDFKNNQAIIEPILQQWCPRPSPTSSLITARTEPSRDPCASSLSRIGLFPVKNDSPFQDSRICEAEASLTPKNLFLGNDKSQPHHT